MGVHPLQPSKNHSMQPVPKQRQPGGQLVGTAGQCCVSRLEKSLSDLQLDRPTKRHQEDLEVHTHLKISGLLILTQTICRRVQVQREQDKDSMFPLFKLYTLLSNLTISV